MMENLRKNPIQELADKKVVKVIDYLDTAATGLPKANVLTYELEDGSSVIIRPSGTEPKIKAYYTTKGKDLAEAQAAKDKMAEAVKPYLS
jgi:phosphoglucomutase